MSHVAEELTVTSSSTTSFWASRLSALFKAIISRIDLSHFPRSCCS